MEIRLRETKCRTDWLLFSTALAITALVAGTAAAETGGAQGGGAQGDLESPDPAKVRQAIEALGAQKSPRATQPIAERIRAGLPPQLLGLAIDTLAAMPRGPGSAVLIELTTHRSSKVRASSIRAAAAIGVPGASRALIAALDDGDGEVRAAAIAGLVKLRAREGMPALCLAFEREVPQAAEAVGQLASQADTPRILGYVRDLPFSRVSPILTTILGRRDVPAPLKVRLVAALEGVSSPEVEMVLQGVVQAAPSPTDPVRRAAQQVLDARAAPPPVAPAAPSGQGGAP
jgi:hypothetical protein